MLGYLGCASGQVHGNATILEASLFDQGAESHVQRRLEQCRYPGQERLGLRQTVKHLTGGGVVPDREQHKKVLVAGSLHWR